MMRLHVILYGPVRGPERLLDVLLTKVTGIQSVVVVRYAGTGGPVLPPLGPPVRAVYVEDPGTFAVEERVGGSLVRRVGASNGRRQSLMIRTGIAELAQLPGSERVLIVRSDLDLYDEARLEPFLAQADRAVADGTVRFVRLTVNSISPFSFTGHRLHGSDWLVVTTLDEARRLTGFDPALFAAGRFSWLDWIRKGDFCFGAFSAEQLLSLGAYLNVAHLYDHGINAMTLPWAAALQFLRDNLFVGPAEAGLGLAKWRYLHDPQMALPHPFGATIRGSLRRMHAWLLFWSELVPPSGRWFSAKLALKALLSWTVHSGVALMRAKRLLLHGNP
jgi:hypothetical protein